MNLSKRFVLGISALVAAAGCQSGDEVIASASEALIFGSIDDGHPAAVALSRFGRAFCTGTLVSPSVVVTAAHCVDMLVGDPDVTIFFGTDIEGQGIRIGVSDTIAHPMWTGNLSGGHDIGMLLMDFPVADPDMAIPLSSFDMGQELGTAIERVGFGIYDAQTRAQDGKKRTGVTTVTSVPAGGDTFIAGDSELITCSGDSGGPAFLVKDGVTYLAGVHSFGQEGCLTPQNGDTRVELYAESFVKPWIAANDPSCGADLVCARIGCEDDPDCEPCGPDGTCAEGCVLPDVDCQDRELGDLCRANSQCTTETCVVWRAEAQTSFCTEACDPNNDACPKGMSCQDIVPLGNICYYDSAPEGVLGSECEENFDCASSICEEGRCVYACDLSKGQNCPENFACSDIGSGFFCHKEASDSGGCSAVAGGSTGDASGLWWMGAFGLLLWWTRRESSHPDHCSE